MTCAKYSLLPCLLYIAFFLVVNGLYIKFVIINDTMHINENKCHLDVCNSYISTCCDSSRRCDVCYNVVIKYTLTLSHKNYTKVGTMVNYSTETCELDTITCYYDDRNIVNSLNLKVISSFNIFVVVPMLLCGIALPIVILIEIQPSCLLKNTRRNNENLLGDYPI